MTAPSRSDTEHRADVRARLRRIEGHIRGIQWMLNRDPDCIDLLTQISAVTAALQAVAVELLRGHLGRSVREVVAGAAEIDAMVTEMSAAVGRLIRPRLHRLDGGMMPMPDVAQMLDASPGRLTADGGLLVSCIESCFACAQSCATCADACLAEAPAEMRECIWKCTTCSDICMTTGRVLSRPTYGGHNAALVRALLAACVESCRTCMAECSSHASMGHCRVCAEICGRCEQACSELLAAIPAAA